MGDFAAQIKNFGDKTEKIMMDVARMSVITLFQNVVKRTPHDTGRARANWQIELDGTPPDASLLDTDKDGEKTCAKIEQAMLAKFDKSTRMAILQNNLVYIKPLEYGHSQKQAPNGMVRISVAEFPGIVAQITRNAK